MGTLIGQELFKLVHKVGTWIAVGVMVIIQFAFIAGGLIYPKVFNQAGMITSDFVADSIIVFIMIASTASIIAMEFQYGTIRQLLYRQYDRSQVFISKLITLVIQLVCLHLIASLVTMVASLVAFPDFDWTASDHLKNYALTQGGETLTLLLLLSAVLLLATLFKTNAAAIAVGFVGYFLVEIAGTILVSLIQKWEWLKWLPFTMLMTSSQILTPGLKSMTKLDLPWMIGLTCAYTVLLTVISYLSFRRRAV